MLTCEQTQGQSVFQHGQSVKEGLFDLLDLLHEPQQSRWRLPAWFDEYREQLLANLHDQDTLALYTVYHDCGKPFCRTVDLDGKVHFPNHAEVSKQLFLSATGNHTVANLIGWDMVLHTASAEEIERYCKEVWTAKDAVTLLLAGLSEIHSNARLFGGIESVSFKSKWKNLDRRGRQICKLYFGGAPCKNQAS